MIRLFWRVGHCETFGVYFVRLGNGVPFMIYGGDGPPLTLPVEIDSMMWQA